MSRPLSERTLRSYYAHAAVEGRAAITFALVCEERARGLGRARKKGAKIPREVALEAARLARAARKAVQEARRLHLTQLPSEDARNASEGLAASVVLVAILPPGGTNVEGLPGGGAGVAS